MDEVVASDGETVAVARNLPDGHVGIGEFEAGGYGCGAAMDGVEAVGVHVVRQTA